MEATNILTNEAFYKLFTGAVEVLEGDRAVIAVNIARLLPNNMEEDALRDAEISLEAWALAGRIWSVKAILLSNICGDAARDSGTRQYTIDRLEYYFKELGICG